MVYLSQRDPRWCSHKLGASQLTIGRYGCTTTCISMLSDFFKNFLAPDTIAAHNEWYTPDGLVDWVKFSFPKMKFDGRGYSEETAKILTYLKDPNKAVMLEVNNGQHWVVALKKNIFGSDYTVLDPWTGKPCNAKGVYHNITGAAYWSKV